MDQNVASTMTLSFSGCGFLCIYHAGVCAAIKEYAPQLQKNKMTGASAGAIAAVGLMCNVCISEVTSTILKVVTQARSRALGALHPAFNLMEIVRSNLDRILPDNAHGICSGRLQISLTREKDRKNIVVSEFRSKNELIQAILCSCFIPYYCGRTPPVFRGEHYFDGGWSDNQPVIDDNTVTVSPFSGESDICPPDSESASLLGFVFSGTSIRFTARNLYRLTVCLIPPATDVCSEICRQGFEDAVRFLTKNGLTPRARCLTVQSSVIGIPMNRSITSRNRNRSRNFKLALNSRWKLEDECGTCLDRSDTEFTTQTASLFPAIVQKALDEAAEGENALIKYLSSFRIVKWISAVTAPFILPSEILLLMSKNIAKWLASFGANDWAVKRLQMVVDFLMKENECQRAMYNTRLTCQLAVTEVNFDTVGRSKNHKELILQKKLSPEAEKELAALRRYDKMTFRRKMNSKRKFCEAKTEATTSMNEKNSAQEELDSLSHVTRYAKEHDAVLAYYYMDDNNKVRVCEIFDVEKAERRRRCLSHMDPMDQNVKVQSSEVLVKFQPELVASKSIEVCEGEGNESIPQAVTFTYSYTEVDSGLSMAEDSPSSSAAQRRDTCCSPIKCLSTSLLFRSSMRPWRGRGVPRRYTVGGGPACKSAVPFSSGRRESSIPTGTSNLNSTKSLQMLSSDSDTDGGERYFMPGRRSHGSSDKYDGEPEQSDSDHGT